jgi:hypothetical protein
MKTNEKIGNSVINFLNLKAIKGTEPKQYNTEWGTKTAKGLGASIERIIEESK